MTSPRVLCDQPLDNPVRPIAMPAAFASAMLVVGKALTGRTQHTVPLVLALAYAQEHRDALEQTHDAKATFGRVMQALQD